MFAKILAIETFLKDNTVHLDNAEHWFMVNFLGIWDPKVLEIFQITSLETNDTLLKYILTLP